jgi:hypothetical protein
MCCDNVHRRVASRPPSTAVAMRVALLPAITLSTIVRMGSHSWPQNVVPSALVCLPNRIKCVLFVSVVCGMHRCTRRAQVRLSKLPGVQSTSCAASSILDGFLFVG